MLPFLLADTTSKSERLSSWYEAAIAAPLTSQPAGRPPLKNWLRYRPVASRPAITAGLLARHGSSRGGQLRVCRLPWPAWPAVRRLTHPTWKLVQTPASSTARAMASSGGSVEDSKADGELALQHSMFYEMSR